MGVVWLGRRIGVPPLVALTAFTTPGITSTGWTSQAQSVKPFATLRTAQADAGSRFGASLAVDSRGDIVAVGAPRQGTGVVYVFDHPKLNWWRERPSPAVIGEPDSRPGDEFGSSVAISEDGRTLLVGAYNGHTGAQAFVFERKGGTWSSTSRPAAILTDARMNPGSRFGTDIALSGDGRTAVVSLIQPEREDTSHGAELIYTRGAKSWRSESAPGAILRLDGGLGHRVGVDTNGDTVAAQWESGPGSCPYAQRHLARRAACGSSFEIFVRQGRRWPTIARPSAGLGPVTRKYGRSSAFAEQLGVAGGGGIAFAGDEGYFDVFNEVGGVWANNAPFVQLAAPDHRQNNTVQPSSMRLDGRVLVAGVTVPGDVAYVYLRPKTGWESKPAYILTSPVPNGVGSPSGELAVNTSGSLEFVSGLVSNRVEVYKLSLLNCFPECGY